MIEKCYWCSSLLPQIVETLCNCCELDSMGTSESVTEFYQFFLLKRERESLNQFKYPRMIDYSIVNSIVIIVVQYDKVATHQN